MRRAWRLGLAVLIVLSCAGCDRATKQIARQELAGSPPIHLLNGWVRLGYAENSGAFLGMGSGWPAGARLLVLVILTGAGLLSVLAYIAAADRVDRMPLVGLSLLAGGGLGNLVDRILHGGAVTDFMRLGAGALRTGVFNLADVAIVAGAAMLCLWFVVDRDGAAGGAHPNA